MIDLKSIGNPSTFTGKVLTEMWDSCYHGTHDGLVSMLKDWLVYFEKVEDYEACVLIRNYLIDIGESCDVETHTISTKDMMQLFDVCEEIVILDELMTDPDLIDKV